MPVAICLTILGAWHMHSLFIIEVNILVLMKWSQKSLPLILSIELKMNSIFWATHDAFLVSGLRSTTLIIYHSNVGVQIIVMLD